MTQKLVIHETSVDKEVIYLTAYHGGKDGRCVQLTLSEKQYAAMTFKEAVDLFETCIAEIKKLGEEYDLNPPWWEEIANKKVNVARRGT